MTLLLLAACSTPEEAPKPVAPPPPPKEDPWDLSKKAADLDIVVIGTDALRYDHVGRGLTPNLDKLMAESTSFSNATAPAPWTVPATTAVWTARWPTCHGVVNKLIPDPANPGGELIFDRLADDIPTFPEQIIKAGWKGAGFTGGAGVSGKFGYSRGFETYIDDKVFAGFDYSLPLAKTWLETNKDGRFFLWVHGYDVHGQHGLVDKTPREAVPEYTGKLDGGIEEQAKLREQGLAAIEKAGDPPHLELPEEDAKFLHRVYEEKIKEADARLGAFIDHLKAIGVWDHAVVALFADHGEEFMEHGYLDHGATVCEHQVHVPLMIRVPGIEGRVISDPVRTLDLFPTLLDMFGIDAPAGANGVSLLPIIKGEKLDLPIYTESDYRLFVHLRAARRGDHKVILDLEDGQKTLHDLGTDPDEQKDLSAEDQRSTYEIEQLIRAQMSACQTDPSAFLGVHQEHIKLF